MSPRIRDLVGQAEAAQYFVHPHFRPAALESIRQEIIAINERALEWQDAARRARVAVDDARRRLQPPDGPLSRLELQELRRGNTLTPWFRSTTPSVIRQVRDRRVLVL